MTASRYAIYWAPSAESPLAALGAAWLGRDAEGLGPAARPSVPGFPDERLAAITAEPRRYGLHATLKPPFALADGTDLAGLEAATAALAARLTPVVLPALALKAISGFLALVPAERSGALQDLAADCVTELDRFRRPAPEAEVARRRAAGLDARHEELLARWGYPYVLDKFRFHVTLTGRLGEAEATDLTPALGRIFAPTIGVPVTIDAIALFAERGAGEPFDLVRRFPFGT